MKSDFTSRLKYGVSAFAVAAILPLSIPASYAADEADDELVLEEVTVTGSRIKRADFDTVSPAVVLSAEFLDARGFTNVADALNEVPAFGIPGTSPTGGQGAADVGQNFVSFFGLGSQRTLTLVNGRRFVAANAPTNFNNAAPGLQVDLNVIPTGLIERVETVATTGAPIYGSDAISGTVNLILKKDFSGLEVESQYGISDQGDADEKRVRVLIGGNFDDDRGNAVISFEYDKRDGLRETDRELQSAGLSFQTNPLNTGPDDGIPDRVLIDNARVLFASFGGQPSLFFGNILFGQPITGGDPDQILHFGPNGDLVPFDLGNQFGAIFSSGGDGVNLSELASLVTPSERFLINGLGRYEITEDIEAYMETFFANSKANSQIEQAVWQTDFFGGSSGAVGQNTSNPLLSSQAAGLIRDECTAAGVLVDGECDFLIARSSRDLALGNNVSELNMFRIVTGLRGDFEVGDRSFNWDISYNFGRSNSTSVTDGVDDRRMAFALDPIAFTQGDIDSLGASSRFNVVRGGNVVMGVLGSDLLVGDIGCSVVLESRTPDGTNVSLPEGSEQLDIDNCVPLSIFGEGAPTPEARAYVNTPFGSTTLIQQQVFQANAGGDLFDLPAGSLGVAVGFEHRREFADFQPDFNLARGGGRSAPFSSVAGGYNTTEFYGEFYAPLLNSDIVDFVSNLSLEGAIRHVENTRSGGAWTWTLGGRFTPNVLEDTFTFRANFTRSIRSPAVTELFLPTSNIFTRANDPCDSANIGSPDKPTREANCKAHAVALGLDPSIVDGFQSNVVNGTVEGTQVGNPNLENEVADSYTFGAVLSPSFIPGLTLAIDYVDISITNAISNLNGTAVTEACYDAADFGETVCDQITRSPTNFQVTFLQTGFTNAGFQNFRAITANLDYAFDVNELFSEGNEDWGSVSMNGTFIHLLTDEISITGSDVDDNRGEVGRSIDRGQLNINYNYEDFSFLWQTRYVGGAAISNTDTDESRDVLRVGSYWNFNAALGYQVTDFLEARVNIDNVFNTEGPRTAGATANGPFVYDFFGRYYRFSLKAKF